MAERLMLDASLLLHGQTAANLRIAFEDEVYDLEPGDVVIPQAIHQIANGEQDYLNRLLETYGPRNRDLAASVEDLTWLAEHPVITPYAAEEYEALDLDGPFNALMEITDQDSLLSRVLLDEWVFLMTQSWIAARRKTTFRYFKQAGAVSIELPREAFDALARRTLRIPSAPVPLPLKRSERLRAVTKWAAAAGAPWTGLIDPLIGVFGTTVAGFFFLFDP